MRLVLFLVSCASVAFAETPFTVEAKVPVGVLTAKSTVIGLDLDERGSVLKTTLSGFALAKGKWKKAKAPFKPLEVDSAALEDAVPKQERAREAFAAGVERLGATEAEPLSGNLTGRFRVLAWGLVVYMENDQVLARVGDATDIKTLPIVKDFGKLFGKCAGTRETTILHVVAFEAWKAVSVTVESTCAPPEGDAQPATRTRRLVIQDVSAVVP